MPLPNTSSPAAADRLHALFGTGAARLTNHPDLRLLPMRCTAPGRAWLFLIAKGGGAVSNTDRPPLSRCLPTRKTPPWKPLQPHFCYRRPTRVLLPPQWPSSRLTAAGHRRNPRTIGAVCTALAAPRTVTAADLETQQQRGRGPSRCSATPKGATVPLVQLLVTPTAKCACRSTNRSTLPTWPPRAIWPPGASRECAAEQISCSGTAWLRTRYDERYTAAVEELRWAAPRGLTQASSGRLRVKRWPQ